MKFFVICLVLFSAYSFAQPNPYAESDLFVKFYDNGLKEYRQTDHVNNDSYSVYNGNSDVESSTFIKTNSYTGESFTIFFTKNFEMPPSQYQADSLFYFGTYDFGTPTASKSVAGIVYVDTDGTRWETNYKGANQIGKSLVVTTNESAAAQGFRYKVSGRFSCNLYNATGQMIMIVNGEFTAKFGASF